jgi:surfactin synthase thioesterase subunit
MLAYELTCRFRELGAPLPELLMVSAHRGPSLPVPHRSLRGLSDNEFLERMGAFQGIPQRVIEHPELRELVLPTLRADMEVCESYAHPRREPLEVPIVAFGGRDDTSTSVPALRAWREHTSSSFELHLLDGGHFFLHSAEDELLGRVRAALAPGLRRAA